MAIEDVKNESIAALGIGLDMGMRLNNKQKWELAYLLIPGVAVIALVTFYPAIYSIWVSFHETNYANIGDFNGIDNYIRFFTDPNSIQSIVVSLIYVIGTIGFAVPIGYGFAILLKSGGSYVQKIYRSILLIPWIISQVVVALLWKWFLDGSYGPFVYFLGLNGIESINFFGTKFALGTLIFTNVWRAFPFVMVMMLAALQTVPEELYESATIDGANALQIFSKITFQYTISTLLITVIMITLEAFNMVTLINTLTAGGPLAKTETLALSVYKDAFQNWELGNASTTGVLILFFNIVFSLGYIALLRREDS